MTAAQTGWNRFWQDEPAARSGATLAGLGPELNELLDAPWAGFARSLPARARVIDLATGGGVVLDLLQRGRSDLKLTGVDAAETLPRRPGMRMRAGVMLDRLPFADGAFDAVTSRFGIEYGPLARGAAEAARVLCPGGALCFLVHHAGSNVVRHNLARREALRWAAHESGWVAKAINLARSRRAIALPVPPSFRAAAGEAAERYPTQSAAWEFLTGLAQVLELTPAASGEAGVQDLVARAEGELARLDALIGAACDADRLAELTTALERGGVQLAPLRTVDEPGGAPLAWLIEGSAAA